MSRKKAAILFENFSVRTTKPVTLINLLEKFLKKAVGKDYQFSFSVEEGIADEK